MCIGIVKDLHRFRRRNMSGGRTHLVLIIIINNNLASFIEDRSGLRQNGLQKSELKLWNETQDLLQGTVQGLCRYLREASAKIWT